MNNFIIRNYETERARLRERINNLNTELTNYMYLEGQHATDQQLADAMAGFRQREREISNAHAANERRLAAVLHTPRFGGGARPSRIAVAPEEEEEEEEEPPPPPIIPPLELPPPIIDPEEFAPLVRRRRQLIRLARATPRDSAFVEEEILPQMRDLVHITGMLLNRALADPTLNDETLNQLYAEAQRAEQMLYEAEIREGLSPRLRHPFDATRGMRAAAREERVAGAQEAVPETIARRGSGIRKSKRTNRGRIFHGGAPGLGEDEPDPTIPSIPIMDEPGLGSDREELIRRAIPELQSRRSRLLEEYRILTERLVEIRLRPELQEEYTQGRDDIRRLLREMAVVDARIAAADAAADEFIVT